MTDEKQKQYEALITARNFHYNNLNKWLMTFYVIIGALFVALWTLHKSEVSHRHMELCVAVVGYVVSIAAWLSGKGYYYWETNWIMLIHHFEQVNCACNDDKVYSVFANTSANKSLCCPVSGANVSTSKVALAITTFITILWGMISIYLGINLLPEIGVEIPSPVFNILLALLISFVLSFGLMALGGKQLKSDFENIADMGLTKENMGIPQANTNKK